MTFSIIDALQFGWDKLRTHSRVLFQVMLAIFALQVVYEIVQRVLIHTLIGSLAVVVLAIAQFVVEAGLFLIVLRIAKGKHVTFQEIIPPTELLWRFFAANVLIALITIGMVFCIVFVAFMFGAMFGGEESGQLFKVAVAAGIAGCVFAATYLQLRFSMVPFAILDGKGVQESLDYSTAITRSHMWQLFGFLLVLVVINVLGAMLLLVGLLVSVPVSALAYAHVYQKLHNHTASH